jgi:hypothetical protein
VRAGDPYAFGTFLAYFHADFTIGSDGRRILSVVDVTRSGKRVAGATPENGKKCFEQP